MAKINWTEMGVGIVECTASGIGVCVGAGMEVFGALRLLSEKQLDMVPVIIMGMGLIVLSALGAQNGISRIRNSLLH